MAKPMTRVEWENWVEKAWDTAVKTAQEPKEWVKMIKHDGLELGHKMAEIAGSNAGEEWKEIAFDAFRNHAKTHEFFTTEQVRLSSLDVPLPPDPRAWGQVAIRAKKAGIVKAESWVRADSRKVHGMVVTLWRSNLV